MVLLKICLRSLPFPAQCYLESVSYKKYVYVLMQHLHVFNDISSRKYITSQAKVNHIQNFLRVIFFKDLWFLSPDLADTRSFPWFD